MAQRAIAGGVTLTRCSSELETNGRALVGERPRQIRSSGDAG
jgi:hypothetical protein